MGVARGVVELSIRLEDGSTAKWGFPRGVKVEWTEDTGKIGLDLSRPIQVERDERLPEGVAVVKDAEGGIQAFITNGQVVTPEDLRFDYHHRGRSELPPGLDAETFATTRQMRAETIQKEKDRVQMGLEPRVMRVHDHGYGQACEDECVDVVGGKLPTEEDE